MAKKETNSEKSKPLRGLRIQTEQTESKGDNKHPIGKQHADKQSEVDINQTVEKGEKDEDTGSKKRVN